MSSDFWAGAPYCWNHIL